MDLQCGMNCEIRRVGIKAVMITSEHVVMELCKAVGLNKPHE